MATTYKKPLKSIVVKTLGGTTINAADTATDPIASDALRDFEGFGTMHIRTANGETLVPFHAVDNIVVTVSTVDATRKDAYCVEESGDQEGGN
jgi:hypothetical protein